MMVIRRMSFWLLLVLGAAFFLNVSTAAALTIAPLRHTVVIDPGETKVIPLFVINDTQAPFTVVPEVDVFTVDPETGQAVFGASDSARAWVQSVESSLTLVSDEHGQLQFRITVPVDAPSGAHYFGIFARQAAGDGMVGVGARAGALVFLHVSGTVREELARDDFSVEKKVLFASPLRLFLQLRNTGNIHVIPEGEIVVLNAFGRVVERISVNSLNQKIFPDAKWKKEFMVESLSSGDIGRLTIRAELKYGLTQQAFVDEVHVWYLPVWVVLLSACLLLSVFAIWLRHRTHKKVL